MKEDVVMSKMDVVRAEMVAAMKAGDKERKDVLSLLLAALKNKAIDKLISIAIFCWIGKIDDFPYSTKKLRKYSTQNFFKILADEQRLWTLQWI